MLYKDVCIIILLILFVFLKMDNKAWLICVWYSILYPVAVKAGGDKEVLYGLPRLKFHTKTILIL